VTISGVALSNDLGQSFGPIDLTTALTFSVNTVWAQVAEKLGRGTMADYMKRFGFYSRPPLDYPPGEMFASGERLRGKLLSPTSGLIDVGRMGIGQDKLSVTPMQMAMVAAAVANGGKLMVPHLTDKAVDQDGRTVETIQPQVYSQVMKPSTAAAVEQMMKKVVEEGTGTPAQLGGIDVAGKTGTAQVGNVGSNVTQPWFIGIAPVANPKVVVAVTVERTLGGFGATVAAPIARDVMQTLLSEGLGARSTQARSSTTATRSSPGSGPAGWRTSSAPRTASSGARWR
jgi:penicillin-binding protein A